jgi:hypothetical protein
MFRAIPATLLVAVALVAAPASAKAPLCKQLTDGPGDAHPFPGIAPSDDSLDILSADVASGPHNIVAAIRVKSLTPGPLVTGGGVLYSLSWTVDNVLRRMTYAVDIGGKITVQYYSNNARHDVPYKLDPATGAIIVTIARQTYEPKMRRKAVLHLGTASSATGLVSGGLTNAGTNTTFTADYATASKTYVDGTPTCLPGT